MPKVIRSIRRRPVSASEASLTKPRSPFKGKTVVGRVYRIFHPDILRHGRHGSIIETSYVGRTEEEVISRFSKHLATARKYKGKNIGGDGKLHAVMWAHDCKGFHVEELCVAYSLQDLAEKELFFQRKFDSIDNGWNKIAASRITKAKATRLRFRLNGENYRFPTYASICRHFAIRNTTLNWWRLKRGLPLGKAIRKAIEGREKAILASNTGVTVFRRWYRSTNEAARNKRLNKHLFPPSTIRARVRRGMSLEVAFTSARKVSKDKTILVRAPDGKRHKFRTLAEAHRTLGETFNVPPYSTVSSYYHEQGMSLEQAFGFKARPWEKKYAKVERLLEKGYRFIGKKSPYSNLVVLHKTKEIFSSVRVFSMEFGIEYTTAASELKAGISPEEILKKRQHPVVCSGV